MNNITRHWLGRTLIGVSVAALVGCADGTPLGPDPLPADEVALVSPHRGPPDLGDCDSLRVPAGHRLTARLYARGDQVYQWNGTSWGFIAPAADLFRFRNGRGQAGTHYAGPTWESRSGSQVVGSVLKRCNADASAIPWLLLQAVSSEGPGFFRGTTFIQRVNTVGGLAPLQPGSVVGEVANMPYTTEYFFYRKR